MLEIVPLLFHAVQLAVETDRDVLRHLRGRDGKLVALLPTQENTVKNTAAVLSENEALFWNVTSFYFILVDQNNAMNYFHTKTCAQLFLCLLSSEHITQEISFSCSGKGILAHVGGMLSQEPGPVSASYRSCLRKSLLQVLYSTLCTGEWYSLSNDANDNWITNTATRRKPKTV